METTKTSSEPSFIAMVLAFGSVTTLFDSKKCPTHAMDSVSKKDIVGTKKI